MLKNSRTREEQVRGGQVFIQPIVNGGRKFGSRQGDYGQLLKESQCCDSEHTQTNGGCVCS